MRDLLGNAAHHLEALDHDGHVPDGDQILDLERGEGAGHLIEPRLVPLERGQRLVGLGQDGIGSFEHVAHPRDIERDDAHGLDREAGLLGHPLGGAVPGPGFAGLDGGVGHELHGRPQDLAHLTVGDDGAVHLGQFAQPGGRELDVEDEAAGAHVVDGLVEAEHDQCSGPAAQNSFQTIPQGRSGSDGGQRVSQQLFSRALCGHGTECIGRT